MWILTFALSIFINRRRLCIRSESEKQKWVVKCSVKRIFFLEDFSDRMKFFYSQIHFFAIFTRSMFDGLFFHVSVSFTILFRNPCVSNLLRKSVRRRQMHRKKDNYNKKNRKTEKYRIVTTIIGASMKLDENWCERWKIYFYYYLCSLNGKGEWNSYDVSLTPSFWNQIPITLM